jgi:hypothetical protein
MSSLTRVIAPGSLGLGESNMNGLWDARNLDGFLFRLLGADVDERTGKLQDAGLWIKAELQDLQRGRRAYEVGEHYYNPEGLPLSAADTQVSGASSPSSPARLNDADDQIATESVSMIPSSNH